MKIIYYKKLVKELFMISLFCAIYVSGFSHLIIPSKIAEVWFWYRSITSLPKIKELIIYFIFSYYSSKLSTFFIFKIFYFIEVEDINFKTYLLILLASFLIIILAVLFIVVQKKLKNIKNINIKLLLIFLVVIISYFTAGRYNSLGTNFIDCFFYNNIAINNYDFLIKIFLTLVCTSIGFSGGEVTPLFSIGLLVGLVLANIFIYPYKF
ncbi:chloride channel protein [Gemella sp. zg-1178]|uniref:chloride channel protein n=1 Tax=Gemella sp. zg-1178 TaxID=2840372 RepID=UPI001C056DED|nr:chloride channel protein [Gemella sp. zg-1178]MBU0279359.1 chloride channel protein [Gemella sp. zg-1178]